MILLRCLHPPGGAVALLAAPGGVADWHFALFPKLRLIGILTQTDVVRALVHRG